MTDRYAVVGHPVAHSRSPLIHAEFARQTGQDLDYVKLLAPLDGFVACIEKFRNEGGKGANVTLPFKLEAFNLASRLSARAQHAQAVNTLVFEDDATVGDNTDGMGLVRDLTINLKFALRNKSVLLLGAGGAARGVLVPLLEQHPAELCLANRSAERAVALVREFARYGNLTALTMQALAGRSFDLVINATSASIHGELPQLPPAALGGHTVAYDMGYGATATPFVRFALAQGVARAADGFGMLVEQAAESFMIWRGVRPDTEPVLRKLRSEIR